jgi:hypothetical protein
MRTTRLALALVGALGLAASIGGCGAQTATRAVTGELRVDTSTMNHPVVIAESSDHRVFVAEVLGSGRFTLQIPSSVSYRLTLATATRSEGIYSAVARINWPLESGPARWATVGAGAMLDLGLVFKRGSKSSGVDNAGSSGGGGEGECNEDDHAGCQSHDSDYDCDCNHHYGDGDHCDGDGNSSEHDHDCDNDDHHKCGGDGGSDDHGGGSSGGHECDGGTSSGGGDGSGGSGGSGGGSGSGGATGGSGGGTTGTGGIN